MGLFGLFGKKETSFEMRVMNVFLIKNHGVVVTGKINKGTINLNDTVEIEGKKYTVFLIDAVIDPGSKTPSQVDSASEGVEAALHLSTMDSSKIKSGNVVIKS